MATKWTGYLSVTMTKNKISEYIVVMTLDEKNCNVESLKIGILQRNSILRNSTLRNSTSLTILFLMKLKRYKNWSILGKIFIVMT
jgi:hypothetical protein